MTKVIGRMQHTGNTPYLWNQLNKNMEFMLFNRSYHMLMNPNSPASNMSATFQTDVKTPKV